MIRRPPKLRSLRKKEAPPRRSADPAVEFLQEELMMSRLELQRRDRELVELHRHLQQSHRSYEALYEFAPVVYLTLSQAGLILDINLRGLAMLGVPHGEVFRQPLRRFVDPADHGRLAAHLSRCQETEGEEATELRLVTHEGRGSLTVLLTSTRVLRSREGVPVFPTVIVDLTEQKKTEQRLRQREQEIYESQKMEAIGQLAGGVAHDFNNLLTGVLGLTQEIQEGLAAENRYQPELADVAQACQRAFSLTRQLLAFSRKQVVRPVVLDLNVTVRTMENILRRLIGENIEWIAELAPDAMAIKADESQIEQLVTNLAVNARDAMPKGGQLRIETFPVGGAAFGRRGNFVCLRVSDTGIGMDAEVQRHIFEPFFTTKTRDKGTGLGLATVYGIIRQNGGHIRVRSQLHEGTTFELFLPQAESVPHGDRRQPGTRTVRGGSEKILIAEDDTIVRQVTRQILRKYGYEVIVAHDGHEALKLCHEHGGKIDLLITDVVMPGMNGGDLAKEVKGCAPEVPVLFMSGYSGDVLAKHKIAEGDIAFIEKAHVATNLAYRVRAILDSRIRETVSA